MFGDGFFRLNMRSLVPLWWNGLHRRFKIVPPQGDASSTLASGTTYVVMSMGDPRATLTFRFTGLRGRRRGVGVFRVIRDTGVPCKKILGVRESHVKKYRGGWGASSVPCAHPRHCVTSRRQIVGVSESLRMCGRGTGGDWRVSTVCFLPLHPAAGVPVNFFSSFTPPPSSPVPATMSMIATMSMVLPCQP